MKIKKELFKKYSSSAPRYTSYPTAVEWKLSGGRSKLIKVLKEDFGSKDPLSLYIHIPFCKSLCHYCGCTVSIRKEDPKYGDEYCEALENEINLITQYWGKNKKVQQFHLGGGTPTFLNEEQLKKIVSLCKQNFDFQFNAEMAIEVDPRTVEEKQLIFLKSLGFNRISFGVQDIDEKVQKSINRIQDSEKIKKFVLKCRELNFDSINLDLIYGLPNQTLESMERLLEFVLEVKPNRIALYSFAHIPWVKKNQKNIKVEEIPSPSLKLDLFINFSDKIIQNDYVRIGMDHFARKDDSMALAYKKGQLNRNFMGYTLLPSQNFLGLGVSAISYLNGFYFQNEKKIPEYYKAVNNNEFATHNELELDFDDLLRKEVIDGLMCRFKLNLYRIEEKYKIDFFDYFNEEKAHIVKCFADDLLEFSNDGFQVTEDGRVFIRSIAMGFDKYSVGKTDGCDRFSSTI